MSSECRGTVLELQDRIKRFDHFAAEFAAVARRSERQAEAAAADGHQVTASDGFLTASLMLRRRASTGR